MKSLGLTFLLAVCTPAFALEALNEEELAATTGGTIEPEVAYIDNLNQMLIRAETTGELGDEGGLEAALSVAGIFYLPITSGLTAEREIVGVDYGDRQGELIAGGVSLQLPVYVERISYYNIRPAGTEAGEVPSMGDVHIEGLRFSDDSYIHITRR